MKRQDLISLEAVLDEPLPFDCELDVAASSLGREPLLSLSPLRMSGEVARIEGGYALQARLVYEGELECSRCLAAYPFREAEDFSLLLYPRRAQPGGEVELGTDDLDLLYYADPTIELSPIAEERVQMAVPMKPLCREDCRGICPGCGKDLNLGACGCVPESADPRWEALRAIREKV
jgi:uncharacterized protein